MSKEDKNDRKRHDNIIKKVFECQEATNGFFEQHLPDEVKQIMRLETIKLTKETFIEEHLRSSACDILFETKLLGGQDGYIYLIVEGQSSHDPLMSFRLLKYMMEICARHLKLHGEKKGLPLVYPMIFWQGKSSIYRAKRNIWDLFPCPKIARSAWVDDCTIVNVKEIPDELLIHNIHTGLFQIVSKYIHHPQVLIQKLDEFGELFKRIEQSPLGQNYNISIVCYILTALEKSDKIKLVEVLKKHTNKGEQIMGSIAQEFIQQGRSEGINIGRSEGRSEGINIGINKQKKEIALKLIYKHTSIEDIVDITGLTVEEIRQLRDKK
jgi:predicted transposase/invertase (TIGR01784 family)